MHLFKNKKIVISGGPGSGKTTLVNLLRVKGYECIDEFSRTIIKRAQKQGENNFFKSQPLFLVRKFGTAEKNSIKIQNQARAKHKNHMFFSTEVYMMWWPTWIALELLMIPVNLTYQITLMIWPCSSLPWKVNLYQRQRAKGGFSGS